MKLITKKIQSQELKTYRKLMSEIDFDFGTIKIIPTLNWEPTNI